MEAEEYLFAGVRNPNGPLWAWMLDQVKVVYWADKILGFLSSTRAIVCCAFSFLNFCVFLITLLSGDSENVQWTSAAFDNFIRNRKSAIYTRYLLQDAMLLTGSTWYV